MTESGTRDLEPRTEDSDRRIDPSIRDEFPILSRKINGLPMVYLDSASTSLKPRCVLDAIRKYHEEFTANVHRATHPLGEEATRAYEEARNRVAHFLNARPDEIVFVRNTTEAVNLVSMGLRLEPDDEILITPLEHHSNQLPWLAKVNVKYVPLGPDELPDDARLREMVTPRTRLMALGLLSNVTGTRGNVEVWRKTAADRGIPFLLDASQAGGHMPMDVRDLGCDFLAFSGHKVCGPSGIGALWGKREWLERMAPPLLGGGMVHESRMDGYKIKEVPWCFEAGTPNIEGAIGFAAALEFLESISMETVQAHSMELGRKLYDGLKDNPRLRLVARRSPDRYGIASFFLDIPGLSAESFGRIMADTYGILLSAGKHCTHPYHDLLGYSATVRASTHVYSTAEEVDLFLTALRQMTG